MSLQLGLSTGVGGLGAVLADVLKHAEVVIRHEQDDATALYPQQMEQLVLEVNPSQQNATLRNAVRFHSLFESQQMQLHESRSIYNVIVYHVFSYSMWC